MASTNLADYSSAYGTPQSQGAQGQQGMDQLAAPDSTYNPTRAPMWSPAPASSQNQPKLSQNISDAASRGTAAPGSPVTANGQIAPPASPQQSPSPQQGNQQQQNVSQQPQQYQQPQQAQQPQRIQGPPLTTPPQGPDPFQGRGVWTGQQWVPNDHPLAQPFLQQQQNQPQNPSQGVQPNPAQYSPYGPYPGRPQGTTYQPTPGPQAPNNFQFGGFNPMDQSGMNIQQNQVLSQILQNPSLSSGVIEQMKAKQRESALGMGQQQQQMALQNAASRGTNLDSNINSQFDTINNNTQNQILGSYRDIDMGAAATNRQDQLNALNASEGIQGGQLQRYLSQFNAGMGQQQAQADENNRGFGNQMASAGFNAQQQQAGVGSNLDAYKTDLGAFFDNKNNDLQQQQVTNQQQLGNAGLDIDRQRLAQQGTQFNQSNQLDWASLLNNMQMGRYGLGLNYAQLQEQAQQNTLHNIGF